MMASGELDGQVALVTGATRGIGRAIALALAQRRRARDRHRHDRRGRGGDRRAICARPARAARACALDVRDAAAIDAVADGHRGASRRRSAILVNNAGITRDNLLRAHEGRGLGRDHGDQPEAGVPALRRRCCAA